MHSNLIIKSKLKFLFLFVIITMLTYPVFYYSYKFGNPDLGNTDYYDYYPVYKELNFKKTESPFNIRLISPFLVHLVYKSGIFYKSEVSFVKPGFDKKIFFSAILVNYISFIISCIILFNWINTIYRNEVHSFLMVLIYIMGFGTQFYLINSLTEGFSILLFLLAVVYYYKQSWMFFLFAFLAVFQREYLLLMMILIILYDITFSKSNKRYLVYALMFVLLSIVLYYVLRSTLFYTPKYDVQLQGVHYISHLLSPRIKFWPYIKQSFLNQNIFLLYVAVVFLKKIYKHQIDIKSFALVLLLFMQAHFVSLSAGSGNSTGRFFYLATPLIMFFLAKEVKQTLQGNVSLNGK